MLVQLLKQFTVPSSNDLLVSTLFNEGTFYPNFMVDLKYTKSEVIIESPFATSKRISLILPTLATLKKKGVRIIVNTRDPEEHDNYMRDEARKSLALLLQLGIQVIYTENHHRKLAIIDRKILWEGSLNILSHCRSKEIMRRSESAPLAWQMAYFIHIDQFIS